MITLLIWSKDRACQLDLLLRSLPNIFEQIIVLYKTSSEEFKNGYELLKSEYKHVVFKHEASFHAQTMDIIAGAKFNGHKICLSTDDTVFFKTPELSQAEISKLFTPEVVTFSFRYGFNTILQNCHTGEYQPALNIYEDRTNHIRWNFNDYHPLNNYGYPFGLDMHVYDGDLLFELAKAIKFNNTNQLESELFSLRYVVPPIICSEKQSSAVNIPCNNMSGITIAGQEYPFTLESLNEKFIDGYRINLTNIQNQKYIGCHQEVELRFDG